jgi:uncharacterized protein (TIGR03067 family)
MRSLVLTVLLLATLSVSGAPAPLPKRTQPTSETLQGEWVVVTVGKESFPAQDGTTMTMTIAGNRMTLRIDSRTERNEADIHFTIDPTRSPKQIDLRITEERCNGVVKSRDEPAVGIYRLVGDTLTMYVKDKGTGKRPTEFDPTSEYQITLKRAKR